MASKNFQSIVSDIIDNILLTNPSADVKVGEVLRDVFIDVQSLQIQNVYAVADAAARAQSILTARAQQLDRLAYNVNLTRNPSTSSMAIVVISIKGGVTAPTLLNIGDQFYTSSDYQNVSQTFINTQATLLSPGQTQVSLPVVNTSPGSQGNVPANSITQSSYDFADEVYNPAAATGGADIESDASLAVRIPLQITGQFLNTYKGISNAIQNVTDLNGTPYVVTPDNTLSRGQYTTDVYLQLNASYQGTPTQETGLANSKVYIFQQQPIYSLNPINSISIFNPSTQSYVPLSLSATTGAGFTIQQDPSDTLGYYVGTTEAKGQLVWNGQPPATPYLISYNYDHTIIDAQASYNSTNEITNNLLFKQAPVIPIYVSASLTATTGANLTTTYQNAQTNLTNLFNDLIVGQALTETEVEVAFLQDSNIYDIEITNLDSTYEIVLAGTSENTAGFINPPQVSQIAPLGYFFEMPTSGNFAQFNVACRLWIGDPTVIAQSNYNSGNFNFNRTVYNGVNDEDMLQITPSWATGIFKFYDPTSQTYVVNFSALPPSDGSGMIIVNIINKTIKTDTNLSYLTLGPSITAPIQLFTTTQNTSNPQYVTLLPYDAYGNQITPVQAGVYKNGVLLNPGGLSNAGDYTITSPDPNTGIIQITFSSAQTPAATDVLQYGILNPNLIVSYTSAQFVK
jgi:hypothetical protein